MIELLIVSTVALAALGLCGFITHQYKQILQQLHASNGDTVKELATYIKAPTVQEAVGAKHLDRLNTLQEQALVDTWTATKSVASSDKIDPNAPPKIITTPDGRTLELVDFGL